MEERGGKGAVVCSGAQGRLTLLDKMSTLRDRRESLVGLTLDAILAHKKPMLPPPPPPPSSRTLLDIIRDEDPSGDIIRDEDPSGDIIGDEEPSGKSATNQSQKDRKSWKLFRDRFLLKRFGAAWTSSVRLPASGSPIQSGSVYNPRSQLCRRTSVRYQNNPSSNHSTESSLEITHPDESVPTNTRPRFTRRTSTRIVPPPRPPTEPTQQEDTADIPMPADAPPARSFGPQISRHNSTRIPTSTPESEDNSVDPFEVAREGTRRIAVALAEERSLSALEAVAAQEAAEAEAAAAATAEAKTEESESVSREAPAASSASPSEPRRARMALMDLLEKTDRQLGLEGSRYTIGDDEEGECEEEEKEVIGGGETIGRIEYTCCVCMVRHTGAAFIPCGHTFCRLCSRKLWVQRGNCPLCNGFILEILDIF